MCKISLTSRPSYYRFRLEYEVDTHKDAHAHTLNHTLTHTHTLTHSLTHRLVHTVQSSKYASRPEFCTVWVREVKLPQQQHQQQFFLFTQFSHSMILFKNSIMFLLSYKKMLEREVKSFLIYIFLLSI